MELSHQAQHDFLTGRPDRSLLNDRITQAISCQNIGKSLKHRVAAEGLENQEQLHFLQQEGSARAKVIFSAAR